MANQGLSRHMYPPLSYSAHRHFTVCGVFDPSKPTTATSYRGAGWSVVNVSTGVFTLTLSEPIRYLLRKSCGVYASDADGTLPYFAQIKGPASDGKTFTITICRSLSNGEFRLLTPLNADDRVTFQVEAEESTGRIR